MSGLFSSTPAASTRRLPGEEGEADEYELRESVARGNGDGAPISRGDEIPPAFEVGPLKPERSMTLDERMTALGLDFKAPTPDADKPLGFREAATYDALNIFYGIA